MFVDPAQALAEVVGDIVGGEYVALCGNSIQGELAMLILVVFIHTQEQKTTIFGRNTSLIQMLLGCDICGLIYILSNMAKKFSCDRCPEKATCKELCPKLIKILPTAEPAKNRCIDRKKVVDSNLQGSSSLGDYIDMYGKMDTNRDMSVTYQGLTIGEKRLFNNYLSNKFEKPILRRTTSSMRYPMFADFVRCKEISRVAKSAGTTPQNTFKHIQAVIRASGKMTDRDKPEEYITPLGFKKRFYERRAWEHVN